MHCTACPLPCCKENIKFTAAFSYSVCPRCKHLLELRLGRLRLAVPHARSPTSDLGQSPCFEGPWAAAWSVPQAALRAHPAPHWAQLAKPRRPERVKIVERTGTVCRWRERKMRKSTGLLKLGSTSQAISHKSGSQMDCFANGHVCAQTSCAATDVLVCAVPSRVEQRSPRHTVPSRAEACLYSHRSGRRNAMSSCAEAKLCRRLPRRFVTTCSEVSRSDRAPCVDRHPPVVLDPSGTQQ